MLKMESAIGRKKVELDLSKEELFLLIIGFFISRACIIERLAPFGISFLSAYLIIKGSNPYLLLSVIIGSLSNMGLKALDYVLAAGSIYLIFNKLKEIEDLSLIKSALLNSIIFFLARLIITGLIEDFYIYDIFLIVFEGILVFTMTYIFAFSLPIEELRSREINNEKLVCSFISLALVLSGLKGISLAGISLTNIISILLIVFLAYKQGVLMGAVSGSVLGLVTFMGNPEMPFIVSILTIGGLLAGLFRDLGKAGSILGFILGNGIISYYINKLGTPFIDYRELFIASISFLAAAQYLKLDLEELFIPTTSIRREYEEKKQEYLVKKINYVSDLFSSLSKTIIKAIDEEEAYSKVDIYNIVDNVTNATCKNCSNYEGCWQQDYYTSYYKLVNLIGLTEIGKDDEEELINKIKDQCIKAKELIYNIDKYFLPMKAEQVWNKRLMEQRRLLADQLQNFSTIIEELSLDLYSNPEFDNELEELLIREVKNKRIDIKDLMVLSLPEDYLEILVELPTTIKDIRQVERLRKIISNALGYKLSLGYTLANNTSSNIIRFRKANRYTSLTEVASLPNSNNQLSGDNYSFGEIGNTNYIAICDGMGTGKKASRESSIAIELLEKLMEINMDKSLIIRTINSFLRIKSNDERFTTLDLGFIDLYTGKLQMIKNGSPCAFIKRKDRVDIISSKSLPIGILEDVDSKIYEEQLEDGDILIMMSDGVLDCNSGEEDSVEWMKRIIMNINSNNPKKIVNEIINRASFICKGQAKDDMTVIATKIWRSL